MNPNPARPQAGRSPETNLNPVRHPAPPPGTSPSAKWALNPAVQNQASTQSPAARLVQNRETNRSAMLEQRTGAPNRRRAPALARSHGAEQNSRAEGARPRAGRNSPGHFGARPATVTQRATVEARLARLRSAPSPERWVAIALKSAVAHFCAPVVPRLAACATATTGSGRSPTDATRRSSRATPANTH